ncbi:VWFA-related domain-containing protein [Bryocella elongata]|uniref:VWFA-related domain-containing protein n=2 Tax=Bryocella elongata TaxID=863522 RepID=A0A1H6ABR1_9BACT|nr:VWFA-related domain-containing protein [Bryocella elongata]
MTPSQPGQVTPQSAANTIRTYSTVVVLDGVALDAKGNPVLDLKADDFKITEDDAPQTIRRFEVPGRTMPPANVDIESTADLDRLAPEAPVNIVLLDEFNTHFEDMAFARYSLKKWLEKQPGKLDEPTMLIAVSIDKFQVLRDYTQDKQQIISALDHHFAANPWQSHSFSWVPERFSTAFITLMRVAEASSGHPGHKDMIWLGRGFPNINLQNAGVDGERQVHNAVQRTVNQLRDARVTLYTIDPAGLQIDPGSYGNFAGTFSPFGGEPNFEALSVATGGRPIHGRNDVDAMIGTAIRDGASLYSMSYRPTNNTYDPQKFRRIKVVVDRPGVTFVTRQGYYPQGGPARPTQDGRVGRQLATELVSASASNMVYDAVPFVLAIAPEDVHQWMVTVMPKGLAWYFGTADQPRSTRLLVTVTTFDKKNKLLKTEGKRMEFKAPMTAPARGRYESGVRFPYKLEPDPKAVRARMVVRVEATGHMGSADFPLTVGTTVSSDGQNPTVNATPANTPPQTTAPPAAQPGDPAPAASPTPPPPAQ